MKPTDDIMRLVRELSRVRFTGADGAEQVARREEDIERLIAEREREARIEGVCKALYHTTALSDAEMRKRAEEWFDEERAR